MHGVVLRAEIRPVLSTLATAANSGRIADRHEARQIVVERTQPVMRPRTDARMIAVEDVMPGVELVLRRVIVIGTPARADDGDIVNHRPDVRPPVGHLDAAFTARPIPDLHWIE